MSSTMARAGCAGGVVVAVTPAGVMGDGGGDSSGNHGVDDSGGCRFRHVDALSAKKPGDNFTHRVDGG